MALRLYNTLSRGIQPLQPAAGKPLGMYCCGPTVYGPAHIGNFRTFLLQDVLRRVLEVSGVKVKHVRNITDVDDKTIRQSQAGGLPLKEFTRKWEKKFREDCAALNMLEPHIEPRATEHIEEQTGLVKKLLENGRAYQGPDGSVYYKVSAFENYGKLSNLDRAALRTQAVTSGEAANLADEYGRESVADFALWKARKPEDGDNYWPSPWGEGRPGWHIECSAMSQKYLGENFDLHGGGVDLSFPHHENEIAQSEGATGQPFCRHWFHCAHLMVEGQKMSKSLGNLYTLGDIRARGFSPMALRYALLSGHYRQPLNFTWNGMKAAQSALRKLEKAACILLKRAGLAPDDFHTYWRQGGSIDWKPAWGAYSFHLAGEELEDDLNIPAGLGLLFEQFNNEDPAVCPTDKELERELMYFSAVIYALGLKLFTHEKKPMEAPKEVKTLAKERQAARQARDWAGADALRDEIKAKGWKIMDRKDGAFDLEPL